MSEPKPPTSSEDVADEPGREDVIRDFALSYRDSLPWADIDAIEVSLSLLRAFRVLTSAVGREIEGLGLEYNLSGARVTLLRTLYFARNTPLPQNEISRRMGVSRTNITNLIDGLERDGLVTRVTSSADRRVSYARLTPEGERVCVEALPVLAKLMGDSLASFSDAEKLQFKSFLYRMQTAIDELYADCAPEGAVTQAR
jgi:DNA-binding MarR family transcriptional regulator